MSRSDTSTQSSLDTMEEELNAHSDSSSSFSYDTYDSGPPGLVKPCAASIQSDESSTTYKSSDDDNAASIQSDESSSTYPMPCLCTPPRDNSDASVSSKSSTVQYMSPPHSDWDDTSIETTQSEEDEEPLRAKETLMIPFSDNLYDKQNPIIVHEDELSVESDDTETRKARVLEEMAYRRICRYTENIPEKILRNKMKFVEVVRSRRRRCTPPVVQIIQDNAPVRIGNYLHYFDPLDYEQQVRRDARIRLIRKWRINRLLRNIFPFPEDVLVSVLDFL